MKIAIIGIKGVPGKHGVEVVVDSVNAVYHYIDDEKTLVEKVSDSLKDEKVIGWHYDRMEFGPRALGHRSIIGDARSSKMPAA